MLGLMQEKGTRSTDGTQGRRETIWDNKQHIAGLWLGCQRMCTTIRERLGEGKKKRKNIVGNNWDRTKSLEYQAWGGGFNSLLLVGCDKPE